MNAPLSMKCMIATVSVVLFASAACADTIKLLANEAMRGIITELQPEFEKSSGHTLVVTWAEAAKVQDLLVTQPFDLVIADASAIDRFTMGGRIKSGSRVDLAKSPALISSAVPATSGHADRAKTFQVFLTSAQAAPAIRKHGMQPPR
jgi:ABC-type molybdate transport system substrate-binding protein